MTLVLVPRLILEMQNKYLQVTPSHPRFGPLDGQDGTLIWKKKLVCARNSLNLCVALDE